MANKKQRPGRKRNPVAHHLFIHRGGVHEKSNSAKRQEGKRQLRKLLAKKGGGISAPDFISARQSSMSISSLPLNVAAA
jgi:hypothetical protein